MAITSKNGSYAQNRLNEYGLLDHPHFRTNRFEQIEILYHHLNGDAMTYHKPDNRKTLAIECPEQFNERAQMSVIRLTPKQAKKRGHKYQSPKGAGAPPYFTKELIEAYQTGKQIDTLILTEGELKAAYAAMLMGIPSVGFKGISNYKLTTELKAALLYLLPKNIVINYDTDAIRKGDQKRTRIFQSSAAKLVKQIHDLFREFPKLLPNIYLNIVNPNTHEKGLDDVLLVEGANHADLAFLTLQNSEFFLFQNIDKNDPEKAISNFFGPKLAYKHKQMFEAAIYHEIKPTDKAGNKVYLLDILKGNNFSLERFFGHQWNVPTGLGKSTATIEAIRQTDRKGVFLVPTISLAAQLHHKAQQMGLDSMLYYGQKADIIKQAVFDRLGKDDLPKLIITTYNSAECLYNSMSCHRAKIPMKYDLIFDEMHNFVTSSSKNFQLDALNGILDIVPKFRSFTGLTATPLPTIHPILESMPVALVRVKQPKPKAMIVAAKDCKAAAAKAIKTSVANGKIPVVLFNNKTDGLTNLLLELGKYADSMLILNADTKSEAEQQQLIETGLLEGKKGIIATSVLKEGISLNNERGFDFIQVGKFHPAISLQFSQRARKAEYSFLTVIVSDSILKGKTKYFNPRKEMASVAKQMEQAVNLGPAFGCSLDIRNDIDPLYIRKIGIDQFEPNYLGIQNTVFEEEKNSFYSSLDRLKMGLSRYFEVIPVKAHTTIESSLETKLELRQIKESRKAAKAQQFNDTIELLRESANPVKAATEQQQENNLLTHFLEIAEHAKSPEKAINILESTEGKTKRLKLAKLRLKAQKANFKADLGELSNVIFALKRKFRKGKLYTKEQLKEKVLECLETDPIINGDKYRYKKRMDKLLFMVRIFYKVTSAGKKGGKYRIEALTGDY